MSLCGRRPIRGAAVHSARNCHQVSHNRASAYLSHPESFVRSFVFSFVRSFVLSIFAAAAAAAGASAARRLRPLGGAPAAAAAAAKIVKTNERTMRRGACSSGRVSGTGDFGMLLEHHPNDSGHRDGCLSLIHI